MPNFRITRKRKQVQVQPPPTRPATPPPIVQEEKYDNAEMEESESSDSQYIDEAMANLNIAPSRSRPRNPPAPPNTPHYTQKRRPHNQERTTLVPQRQKPASYDRHFGPTPRIGDPYRRKTTMTREVVRPKKKSGGAKIRFRSHYGADAEHLDTRTKSIMLLNHCFG